MWSEYGVSAPVFGYVYDSTVAYLEEPSGRLAIGHLAQPRIEPEIILQLSRAPRATQDEAELQSCIDWIAHGYEIVQSHFPGWRFQAPDTIAAFGLHGALVVGPRRAVADLPDLAAKLRAFTIALARDGRVEALGGGRNVLDSPLLAAAHLGVDEVPR
jgi:2-oxo-3-hexenedioate decarboxylase